MRTRTPGLLLLVAAAHGAIGLPRGAEAMTQVNTSVYAEDAMATRPGDQSNLLQTGVNVAIVPSTKKKISSSLNLRFNYIRSDEDALARFSPLGNIGLELAGEAFSLSVARSHHAVVSTTTELTETVLSQASFSLLPKEYPRLFASVSRAESSTASGQTTQADTGSVSVGYRYEWAEVQAGYTADRRASGQTSNESNSQFVRLNGSYEVLPATLVTGELGATRFDSRSGGGAAATSTTTTLLLNGDSRPLSWVRLVGNYSRTATEVESSTSLLPSTTLRLIEGGTILIPHRSLQLGATVGNRRFNDVQAIRNVDYRILSATFAQQLELRERILFGATTSRSFESDPRQGENITDSFGINLAGDVVPRVSLRFGAGVSRSENRSFVSAPQTFNASGNLAERDRLDTESGGLPAGFTFFDVGNNDLYTKNSPAIGDWSLPVHSEPLVERFGVSRSVQIAAAATDRVNVNLSYTSSSSSADLDLWRVGAQSLNGSLAYVATRRSSFGVSGIASFPERGTEMYAANGSFTYRLVRGHQMSLSYGRQVSAARRMDTFAATLRMTLRKRTSADLSYSATELFRDTQTQFIRVRLTNSF